MKKSIQFNIRRVLALCLPLFGLALAGCGTKTLDWRNADVVNGKVYNSGANEPFTGKVTNIPDKTLFSQQEGFQKFAAIMDASGASGSYGSLCDGAVDAGLPDGDYVCKLPQSEAVTFKATFNKGVLDGELAFTAENGKPVSSVSFKEGKPDGKQQVFNAANGQLVRVLNWKNGIADGEEAAFDASTGKQTVKATWVEGKLNGPMIQYAPDGERVIHRVTYDMGVKEGVEEVFDENTGQPVSHLEWLHGKENGWLKNWDGRGHLLSGARYVNGVVMERLEPDYDGASGTASTVSNAPANPDQCVSQWIAAFHKEQGADTPIGNDQLEEWAGWCKDGKHPG